MAATSSGRRDRPQKGKKGGTESTRKHRFESFNQRIAKLNIDPIRRVRRQDIEQDDLEKSTSFFKTGLEYWKDINWSENFTAFAHEVEPLCESFVQILHYQTKIVDILCKYTEKRDVLSLEPLLSLISHLAHDLGIRFEAHFARAVTLVTSLAAKHPAVEVIEWSFTCLAWLFKYLSRLLAPDLRAVYDIMAPLLGKETQKKSITRFAAEAMSFLVRKAALVYHKDPVPLDLLVNHVLDDLEDSMHQSRNTLLYEGGIMTLFADAIKGINRGVHSCGTAIYERLLGAVIDPGKRSASTATVKLLRGVTVNVIHHTDEATFSPLLDVLLNHIENLVMLADPMPISAYAELLYVVVAVRKGSRIQTWQRVLSCSVSMLQISNDSSLQDCSDSMDLMMKGAAVILQYSPLDVVIPKVRLIMECMLHGTRKQHFLLFCNYFCDLGRERFKSLISPFFFKYLATCWKDHEPQLLVTVPQLLEEHSSKIERKKRQVINCPRDLQQHVMAMFGTDNEGRPAVFRLTAYLELLDFLSFDQPIVGSLLMQISTYLSDELRSDTSSEKKSFVLGACLSAVLCYSEKPETIGIQHWPWLCSVSSTFGTMSLFLENLLTLCGAAEVDLTEATLDPLITALIRNLAASSGDLRKVSLRLLNALYKKVHGQDAEILTTALTIETTPLDLQSARVASMHVRRLSSQYTSTSSDPWLSKAIPFFCFGLFTFKLAQLWDDAVDTLRVICETKAGEEVVSDIAFQWLEQAPTDEDFNPNGQHMAPQEGLTEFECSNLTQLDVAARKQSDLLANADQQLQARFDARHRLQSRTVRNAPSHALRVFAGMPHIAEKRSRRMVPLFLRWITIDEETDAKAPGEGPELEEDSSALSAAAKHPRLGRNDYKSMLQLFGSFTNPRVLFQSPQVFKAVLDLLMNGDVEIQKAALGAISTWKLEGVQPYKENFTNLLDDSRFREELSVFLQNDEKDSAIQPGHLDEAMPVLLRLLYGRVVTRSGSSGGQTIRRKAVLTALSRLSNTHLRDFVLVALGPLQDLKVIRGSEDRIISLRARPEMNLKLRNQMGIVTMMKDLLETMGGQLSFLLQEMVHATLYCICCAIPSNRSGLEDTDSISTESSQASLRKVIRQVGLRCLTLMFKSFRWQEMEKYIPLVFSELIVPRLERLPIESAQSVSGMLQLFAAWAANPQSAPCLTTYDPTLLDKIVDCVGIQSAKDEVKLFVIDDILKQFIGHIDPLADQRPSLDSSISHILEQTGFLMKRSPSKQLLESAIKLVSMVAPIIRGSSQVRSLLDVSDFLLGQPSHRVSPRSKGDLLKIVLHFVPLLNANIDCELQDRLFSTVSSLFGYFKDRPNRTVLSEVLAVLAEQDGQLQVVAPLCIDLNSFSAGSIDEADFERRLKAFNLINEIKFAELSPKQWRPIIYNMLFFVRDTEELAIRSNASYALRRFVEANQEIVPSSTTPHSDLLKQIVLPALRNGASEQSELVRAEYLSIMAHLVRSKPEWNEVKDMVPLLVADDEEASFFNNVLHIQHHRRLRALRRLATEGSLGHLGSSNIAHFLVPLLEHFIFDKADDENSHNLAAEATNTIGTLAEGLEWPQLRAIFRRFCSYIRTKPELEKSTIKLIGVIIDAMGRSGCSKQQLTDPVLQDISNETDISPPFSDGPKLSTLAKTMPRQEKLTDDITKNLLPSLQEYLHNKDESTVSLRVRVAVSVVKMLKILPPEQLSNHLPPLLTDVCHILRSRAQESRDLTRRTLVEISTLIGPSCFAFILKELRSSLARGYQLHVLSYTVHSMMVATSPIFKPGDLDYCLPQIVAIIMDDIFGPTGQEKDAEEYISKMKEVKSSKSFDSMELIAKTATISHVSHLIRPLQVLLEEKLDLKMIKKIDELLRRIGVGLLRNEAIGSRETLIFCFEILCDVHKANTTNMDKPSKEEYRVKRYLVISRGSSSSKARGTSSYQYKLARFSLDVLRSVLHKYNSLQTSANLSGFMPAIGDALLQAQEEVQISALRLLATIIKIPLKEIDEDCATYIAEAMKAIKNTNSTNTELAQAALKLISAVLRERHQVFVKESDIAYLLKRLKPDLEEPDRQGVTFNFLKAVMARKVVIPEVYEVLDLVAGMMVTNQTHGARDLARGVYFQFLLNYPQGKERLSKQLGFLVKNLDYKHAEGRQSIMEAIHLLLTKLVGNLAQDLVGTFFVPLVMVTVNDESLECRKMAGVLLKEVFEQADAEKTLNFLGLLRTWVSQDDNNLLIRVSLQTFATYLDVNGTKAEREVPSLQARLTELLHSGSQDDASTDWEVLYFSLQLAAKLCSIFPVTLFRSSAAPLWVAVRQSLYFPHAWVKLACAKLLGGYFADFARTNADAEHLELPLIGSGGLRIMPEEMIQITKASLSSLRVPGVSEELAAQSVRNLVFLGRSMGMTSMIWGSSPEAFDTDDSDKESQDENDELCAPGSTKQFSSKTALQYIFERLSAVLRREPLTTKAPSLIPKTASLQLLAALCKLLSIEVLSQSIDTILLPLHNLTDPSIPAPYSTDEGFQTTHQALVSTSQEIMSLLQKKMGTTDYVTQLSRVREGVKQRREGRRTKRRLEAVAEPEKTGRDKRRKGEKKKEKRKERSGEARSRRRGW
ncbi:U3 snoRNP protein [Trapelia coarctata]|nr:U3 snoRNP protein [Trapelia coarctata]